MLFHVEYIKGCFLQVLPTGEFTALSINRNYLINIEKTLNISEISF